MTKPFIEIEIDDREILGVLQEMINRGQDLGPAMRDITTVMEGSVRDAFDDEIDPDTGKKWDPLSARSTIPSREQGGHWPGSILQVHGQLAASISPDYGSDYAAVGTNLPYGRTHQFGASRGEFGATRYGVPIPWGDVPARPFLGIGPEGREEILEILTRHLDAG